MDKIVKPDRGRVYQCTICDFLGERKTALKHFRTKHVTAHEEQYHCNICSFHSHDFQLIKRHGSFYKPHNALKEEFMKDGNYLGSDDQHIIENENFRKVDPERDLKRWEAAESNAHWFSKCKKSTAVVASSTLKLIQPVVSVVNIYTTPVSTTCTISDVPPTVSYSPPRIVLDNIADQLIALSEDVTPSLPEPLRSPPYITPRPVLPDIPIPPPDNDIELDLRHQLLETSENFDLPQTSSDYPTSVLEVLIKVGQKTNNYLKEISNQLKRNHDQMEKIEIAVRRSYSHQNVRPVYNHNRYIPPRSPIRNRPPFNPVNRPLKRKFIQEKSVSPVKKVKSNITKKSRK
jgi:hypothetical protein